jgi:hypothetical protein
VSGIEPTSRYAGTEIATSTTPEGTEVRWFRRRFIPSPEQLAVSHEHVVRAGERLDLVADAELGEAELWWRVADANRAMRPDELTAEPGRRLRIAQPPGFPGAAP